MVNWQTFGELAPELAERGAALLNEFTLAFLATTRKDGSPRLHPIVPIRAGAGIYVAIPQTSPKRHDLRRSGLYAPHALPGEGDEEFLIRGLARLIDDPTTVATVAAAAGHVVHPTDDIFEFRIQECLYGYWKNVGQPDTYAVRRRWPDQPT